MRSIGRVGKSPCPYEPHPALRATLPMKGRETRLHRPLNSGFRFCTNAAMPSFWSSKANRL